MLGKSKLERAQGELVKAVAREHEWSTLVDVKRAELAAAEATGGAELLLAHGDDLDAGTVLAQLRSDFAGLREAIGVAERTAVAARLARVDSQHAAWQAEAAELRARAVELRREADGRQRRTDELLAELAAHEECEYSPAEPDRGLQPHGAPVAYTNTAAEIVYVPRPRTLLMRWEADGLDGQAAELEQRRVATSGGFSAWSIEELVATVEGAASAALMPSASAVRSWAEREVKALGPGRSDNVVFEFIWRDGQVDEQLSSAARPHDAIPRDALV